MVLSGYPRGWHQIVQGVLTSYLPSLILIPLSLFPSSSYLLSLFSYSSILLAPLSLYLPCLTHAPILLLSPLSLFYTFKGKAEETVRERAWEEGDKRLWSEGESTVWNRLGNTRTGNEWCVFCQVITVAPPPACAPWGIVCALSPETPSSLCPPEHQDLKKNL